MRALAAGSGIAALALLAWLVAGGGWSAVTYRYQQAELAAALPALQLTEALASLRVANEQARAGAPVSGPLLAVTPADEWFARPVDERWADYQSAEWRPVRRLTRGYVGLLALLLFGRPLVKGLWYLLMLAATRRTAGPGISHGSARWATPGEARRLRPRPGRTDLVVGRVGRRPVSVPEEEQYEHLLLVAPTGAGKTSGVIIPNLLREPGARSLVITDPKRELLRATAPALRWRYGDANVWALDFLDPALSLGYNPLAYVRDAATADVFAQTWVANTGTNSKDVFWENAARTLIAAAALHLVRTDEGVPPLAGLVALLCGAPAEEVRATLARSPVPEVRRVARGFLANMAKNERLLGSVFAELPPRFACLNLPEVRATTGVNEIDLGRLGRAPTALYIALDLQYTRTLAPLTACFFLHFFTTLTDAARARPSGALPVPVFCYLDEFGTLGYVPAFADRMASVRSARIGCLLVVQDRAQLTKGYGAADADTILTNAGTKLCLSRVTHDDARYFSDLAGTTTVLAANQGATRPLLLPWADRRNRGQGETSRRLITPDELRTMGDDILVVSGHRHPLRARQSRYYRDPALLRLVPDLARGDPLRDLCRERRRRAPLVDPATATADELPDAYAPAVGPAEGPFPGDLAPAVPGWEAAAGRADDGWATAPAAPDARPAREPDGGRRWDGPPLTPRERLVLARLDAGATIGAIARDLGASENAVKQQTYRLRQKLGAASTAELLAIARRRGLLEP